MNYYRKINDKNRGLCLFVLFLTLVSNGACADQVEPEPNESVIDRTIKYGSRLKDSVGKYIKGGFDDGNISRGQESYKKPILVIDQGRIKFNGKKLSLPAKIGELVNVLGPFSRNERKRYTWDKLGIYVLERHETKKIESMDIQVKKKTMDFSHLGGDWRPEKDFPGTLIIDGVKITQKTTIWELNSRKSGLRFYESYMPTKFEYRQKTPVDVNVWAILSLEKTIYDFELDYDVFKNEEKYR